jgi:hypothetical protein
VREGNSNTHDEDYYYYHRGNDDDSSAPFLLYVSITVHNSSLQLLLPSTLAQWYELPLNFVPSAVGPERNQSSFFS